MIGIYIAGPMRGIPQFNFPAFDECEAYLRSIGFGGTSVFSPAAFDRSQGHDTTDLDGTVDPPGFSLREALKADTAWICEHATHILLLDGWKKSKGARMEKALGEALGLEIIRYRPTCRLFARIWPLGDTEWKQYR